MIKFLEQSGHSESVQFENQYADAPFNYKHLPDIIFLKKKKKNVLRLLN